MRFAYALWLAMPLVASWPILLLDCTPPSTPPGPDASDAAVVVLDGGFVNDEATFLCSNLSRLGCEEGSNPKCPGRVRTAVSRRAASESQVSCAARAADLDTLRGCGGYWSCSRQ